MNRNDATQIPETNGRYYLLCDNLMKNYGLLLYRRTVTVPWGVGGVAYLYFFSIINIYLYYPEQQVDLVIEF